MDPSTGEIVSPSRLVRGLIGGPVLNTVTERAIGIWAGAVSSKVKLIGAFTEPPTIPIGMTFLARRALQHDTDIGRPRMLEVVQRNSQAGQVVAQPGNRE